MDCSQQEPQCWCLVLRGNTEYGRVWGRSRQIVWIRKCYRFLNKEGSVYPASVRTAGVSLALSVPLTQWRNLPYEGNKGIYESTEPHQVLSVTVYKQLNTVVVVAAVVQLHSVWIMTAGAGRPGCSHSGRHGGHRHYFSRVNIGVDIIFGVDKVRSCIQLRSDLWSTYL